MKPIENRYEFLLIFDCENGNPNGDPDAENLPRIDSQDGHGLVSPESIKRKIRDRIALNGIEIFIQHQTNLNRAIFAAREQSNTLKDKSTKITLQNAAAIMCKRFYDVRTFGGVMTTGVNSGQLTGPVQITLARSVDPVHIMDWGITRVAVAETVQGAKTLADYEQWESEQNASDLRTMGRKSLIPYGLFVAKGCISAFDAERTGFSEADLELLCESMLDMFEHSRSASRGLMTTRRLVIFKHIGSSKDPKVRLKQAKLGRIPAQNLLELGRIVRISRVNKDAFPRAYHDYDVVVDTSALPETIEVLDLDLWDEEKFRSAWV